VASVLTVRLWSVETLTAVWAGIRTSLVMSVATATAEFEMILLV